MPYPLAGETSTSLLLLGDVNNLVGSGEASTSTDSLLCPRTIVFWLSKSSTLGDMWPLPKPWYKVSGLMRLVVQTSSQEGLL